MKIFYNDTSLDIEVNDNSYRYRAIKGGHSLTLYFSLPRHIELPVGAYCVFETETYTLETPENFRKHNSRNFEYTVVFESSEAKARKYKFRNPVDGRLKFNLTATPREHLQMFVDNMNTRDSGWTIGQCVDAPEKLISYNQVFCMEALSRQAAEFKTEYEFNGKQVSLCKVEYNKGNPLPLSYGRGKGFKPGVGRTNFNDSKPLEVLFVQGGEKNIDASKYKSRELLLPKGQTLRYDGACFEGQTGFDASAARTYVSDAEGFSILRQDKPLRSMEEGSLDLSHIYPSRVGEVTGVEVTKEGFCDFFDTTIPSALDFSKPESRFKGETMTVIFQSGMLAGKEFEIQQNETRVFGYVHAERRFKVVEQLIDGEPMPKGKFLPAVGDKYAVFGISLPDAYVCDDLTKSGASWDMFREAAKYLYENEEPKFTFTGELDGIWAKKDWVNIGGRIRLGGYVLFCDDQFQPEGVGIRIVGIKDYINNPHSPEIELSNSVVGSSVMSDIRKIESNEVAADSQHKAALQFTKRQFRDAKQTMAMLEAAFGNLGSSIQPVTVRTMQLLAGDQSLQFQFVLGSGTTADRAFSVVFDKQTKQLQVGGGLQSGFCRLQHKTIGITSLAPSHRESEYRFWVLEPFTSARLTEADQCCYLYAKCRKDGKTSLTDYDGFVLQQAPQSFDADPDYYYMLVGILNSESSGERSFASLYGYTEVLPGRMTTDLIVSSDGNTYFDLLRGVIGGTITFTAGSSGLENLSEWQSKQSQIDQAGQAAVDAQEKVDNLQIGGVNLILDATVRTPAPFSGFVFWKHLSRPLTVGQTYIFSIPDGMDNYTEMAVAPVYGLGTARQLIIPNEPFVAAVAHTTIYIVGDNAVNTGKRVKLEQGNKVTAWTAAPEDIKAEISNIQTSAVNYLKDSRMDNLNRWITVEGTVTLVEDPKFGTVVQYQRVSGSGNFQHDFAIYNKPQFSDCDVIYYVIAKDISGDGSWAFGGWTETVGRLNSNSNSIDLGGGWKMYWTTFRAGATLGDGTFGINSIMGTCQFYAAGVSLGKNPPSSWTIAEGDLQGSIKIVNSAIAAMNDDGVFDIAEKQSIRTQWENISGISNTIYNPATATGGSYIKTLNAATTLSVSASSLTSAFNALRAYLNALELYANSNKHGFDRSGMAAQFTAYYDAEAELSTLIGERQTVVQGEKDKNAVAKDLGYADYAEMERAAKAGRTIIEGGKIRTELLEASQIVALGVDVVNGSSRVKITPDEGMTLLENNKVTAKFTGQQIGSVLDNIPVNSNVLITEQKSRFSDIPEYDSTTLTLASGVISGTSSTPVSIEIPPIRIYALMKLVWSEWTPRTTMHVNYLVNGVAQSSFEFTIEDFEEYEEQAGQDQEGYPIYETRYCGEMGRQITTPAFVITANSSNKPVLVQVRYSFRAQPDPGDRWDNKLYAQFPGSALEATPASKYLDVGGLSFNSTFYGNGLIFSKSTNQIVGMCATTEGTELIARAGSHGLRVDNTGVARLKSDGSGWDNSGLLCGYHVNVGGDFQTRFGIKDKKANRCVFQRNPGVYRLTHNIGHTDYVASVMIASGGFGFTNIGAKSANYVDVEMRDYNEQLTNRPFMILIFGRP